MSTFSTGITEERGEFNEFFSSPKKIIPSILKNTCSTSSWIHDKSFEIQPSVDLSQLPETMENEQVLKKRKKSIKSIKVRQNEEKPMQKKTKNVLLSNSTFFESISRAKVEIQKIRNSPKTANIASKWRIRHGICIESTENLTEEEPNSTESVGEYEELMQLFAPDTIVYSSVNFNHSYSFDWPHFEKNGMQYVVFTKTCQSHEEGFFVEMRKEDTKCTECGGEDLKVLVRLTIPLNLFEISLPITEKLAIHVAFPPEKLPGFDDLPISRKQDFSAKTTEKMLELYRNLMKGKESKEYEKWFQRCRQFAKSSLESKNFRLYHGRVIRRKVEEIGYFKKRRCFIFADTFEFEDL